MITATSQHKLQFLASGVYMSSVDKHIIKFITNFKLVHLSRNIKVQFLTSGVYMSSVDKHIITIYHKWMQLNGSENDQVII